MTAGAGGRPRAPRTPPDHSHRGFVVTIMALAMALLISWLLFWTGIVGHAHLVALPRATVTATATEAQPAEPAPAPTVTKKVKVYVTRTAVPRPSPVPGIAPGGQPVWIVWQPTIHIGRDLLNLFCEARKAGSSVVIPPPGDGNGYRIHCTGLPIDTRGFDFTKLCSILTRYLHGDWVDLGNKNDPNLWECQRE